MWKSEKSSSMIGLSPEDSLRNKLGSCGAKNWGGAASVFWMKFWMKTRNVKEQGNSGEARIWVVTACFMRTQQIEAAPGESL